LDENGIVIKSVFGIFSPGLKSGFFARFSPFFTYIVATMRMKKRIKRAKNPSFQPPAKNPEHALKDCKKTMKLINLDLI